MERSNGGEDQILAASERQTTCTNKKFHPKMEKNTLNHVIYVLFITILRVFYHLNMMFKHVIDMFTRLNNMLFVY